MKVCEYTSGGVQVSTADDDGWGTSTVVVLTPCRVSFIPLCPPRPARFARKSDCIHTICRHDALEYSAPIAACSGVHRAWKQASTEAWNFGLAHRHARSVAELPHSLKSPRSILSLSVLSPSAGHRVLIGERPYGLC